MPACRTIAWLSSSLPCVIKDTTQALSTELTELGLTLGSRVHHLKAELDPNPGLSAGRLGRRRSECLMCELMAKWVVGRMGGGAEEKMDGWMSEW